MSRPSLVLAVAALAGAATMTVELAAVRLLAPWFGASASVWTNVIGVILLALAVGYLAGARLSQRGDPLRRLAWVLCAGAGATLALPALARPVAESFLPSGLALDQAASHMVWGSLASALVLFLPCAVALGCVGPLAVEAMQRARGGHAGDAGGRVLCASTLGSLAGTFGATHLFVPLAGLRWTFAGAALVLAACAIAIGLGARARAAAASATALCLLALLPWMRFEGRAPAPGTRLLEARQSAYQALRVVEVGAGAQALRRLEADEGFDSFQSVWQPQPGLLPPGHYYNAFVLPAWWSAGAERAAPSWRVLILGLGAGTAVRVLEAALPPGWTLDSTGIEIDPAVVELGERWFDLERDTPGRRVLAGADARAALRALEGRFDQIVVDAFAHNMEVPAHLSTVEFFGELRGRLVPGGWLSVNAAGFGLDDPVVRALGASVAEAFGAPALALRLPFSRNCALLARRDARPPAPGEGGWHFEGPVGERLLPPLELPGAARWIEAEGLVLRDDRNPIEGLQRASIEAGRARWARVGER